jgi:hypothetical protein
MKSVGAQQARIGRAAERVTEVDRRLASVQLR